MAILSIAEQRRKTIPGPTNPMDKCTIISIFNKRIHEEKVTIQPGKYTIAPGTIAKPSLLVVGTASWWKEIDEEQPLLEIPNSSIQVADAIVRDYCNGLLGCNMVNAMPGLFFVPGNHNLDAIRKNYSRELEKATVKQIQWYKNLIRLADGLWARTNGNPLVIHDDMRLAASELNDTQKDWMKDFTLAQTVRCDACGSPRNPNFPVCANCKAILDPARAKELGIVFAQ